MKQSFLQKMVGLFRGVPEKNRPKYSNEVNLSPPVAIVRRTKRKGDRNVPGAFGQCHNFPGINSLRKHPKT